MSYIEWEDEQLNETAVRLLVQRHREEYDALRGDAIASRIRELERQVLDHVRLINQLRAQNPDGISVPSLTETAGILSTQNDELSAVVTKLERRVDKLMRENTKLRQLVAEGKP